MIKLFTFLFVLAISFSANAQFAPGYAPRYDEPEEQTEETSAYEQEEQSSVFQSAPVVAVPQAAPEPVVPKTIQKPTPYVGNLRILATVNGEIITTEDINHRVRAFCMTTGIPYNEQTKLLIINKVMQNTIDEKLKLQDAIKNKIDITEEEIDNAVKNFALSNNSSPEKLKQAFKEYGVSEEIFREQMKSDLGWVRLVRNRTSFDTVTEIEIQDALELAKKDISKEKYMVSEIVISKNDARNIYDLSRTLRQDPRFEMYAAQFSQSPSASSGGRLGWINVGQLPEELDKKLQTMSSGDVSDPILYNGSYHILKVEKKFDPEKDKMPDPTAAEIEDLLQGQKTERFASKHLQYLRQKASIELKE
ncbi:MAG: peptidylprolyl isomerase [Alphaproteobacteria bacterium]|nr:peptidylprolyl isomerase [Alphaproteobacteria bacterium]